VASIGDEIAGCAPAYPDREQQMHPFNSPDGIEKTFITVGMIAGIVLILTIAFSFFLP